MEYKNLTKSSFNFAFILQTKNVDGIATSARNFYFKTCSHYRWRFFKVKSPPPHYLICSLQLRVWVLGLFMFPLRSTLVGGFFFLPWLGYIHLVPFPPSFLGVLLFWHLTGFHHYYCQLEYVENVPHVRFPKQCHLQAQVISSFSTYQIPSGTP